jgi:hypothetical protein
MCSEEKELDQFNERRCNQCRGCETKWKSEWYKKNKKKIAKKTKTYRKKNIVNIKTRKREYYLENKEHIDQKNKLYEIQNKEKMVKYRKSYYIKNKTLIHEKQSLYLSNNIQARIKHNLRIRTRHVLKGKIKSGTTIDLLGCQPEFLISYIEKQFKEGMTWDNYGRKGWHIDHILPCASFDLTDPEHQRKCFHYTNLQPLWAADNIRKSDKVPDISQ